MQKLSDAFSTVGLPRLVFIQRNYAEKVWTKYERDIMTHSGRRGHIIPVVLDDVGAKGIMGISASVGRIDLREQWAELRTRGSPSANLLSTVRNRCVLPILEKLAIQNVGPSMTVELEEGSDKGTTTVNLFGGS